MDVQFPNRIRDRWARFKLRWHVVYKHWKAGRPLIGGIRTPFGWFRVPFLWRAS